MEANQAYFRPEDNFMAIELFVQTNTTISVLGPMPEPPMEPVNYQTIDIENAGSVLGPVIITGYVKLAFASVVSNNSTYGSTVITDAQRYILNVFVTSYDETRSPPLGSHVSVQGHLRRTDTQIILQVATMTQINIVDDIVLSEEQMRVGFRAPPRGRIPVQNGNAVPVAAAVRRGINEVDGETNADEVALRPAQRLRLDGVEGQHNDDVPPIVSQEQANVVGPDAEGGHGRGL